MYQFRMRHIAFAAALTVLAGCSTVRTPSKADPLEGFNRTMFTVNDTLDTAILKPVARGYNFVVPRPVRNSVSYFFSNIGDVYTAANDLLQGKIAAGTEDIMRVAINTVFGVGGLFDVASQAGLPKHEADFGLTLGHYGVPPGPYLVLPLLGPSTVRDGVGFLVDRQADPTSYINPSWLRTTLYGIRLVSARASLIGASDLLVDAALDKYSFVRNAYLQRRQYLVYDGNPPPPTYDDEDSDSGPSVPAGASGVPASGAATAAGAGASVPEAAPASAASSPAATVPDQAASDASDVVVTPPKLPPAALSGPEPSHGASDATVSPQQMMPPATNFFPTFRLH